MNTIIEVKNLSKLYKYGQQPYYTLRDTIDSFIRSPLGAFRNIEEQKHKNDFWALKNVSFSVEEGEILGIIGPNGAGKSTLLKILSQITPPTKGEVLLRGRVGSLLEVGTGFHPELSGRENIYLNGAILGMSSREINSKFKEIVDFSELGKFIDMPVKKYSSGMYVRLAFSVAAHLEPEILLVDEVLAVGDVRFQRKSLGKMDEVAKKRKRTVIFISHDLSAVKKLCKMTALIDKGKLVTYGPTAEVINSYLEKVNKAIPKKHEEIPAGNRSGTGEVRITRVHAENSKGREIAYATSGESLTFVFTYKAKKDLGKVNLSFSIHSLLGQNIILHQSKYSNNLFNLQKGKGEIVFTIDKLPLISGYYLINLRMDAKGVELDYPKDPVYKLRVVDGAFFGPDVVPLQHSPILINGDWKLQ